MRLVIVTGMSGAGKTSALKMLEDLGFYCVDNLPIPLMEAFVELVMQKPAAHEMVALGIDIRSGEELPQLEQVLENWKQQQVPYEILFLDSSDATLVKRYKETRRSHPLAGKGRVDSGIRLEREKLDFIKRQADVILDTSSLLTRELRKELEKIFVQDHRYQNLFITVLSFGFKYGIPSDADLVFDVRFLPNPYYVEALGAGSSVLDLEDFLVSNILLPLGSLVYLLFATWDFGWGFDKYRAEANEGVGIKVPAWIRGYVKYILPLMILGLFVQGIWVKFFA